MGNGSDREEQKRGQRKQEEGKREIVQSNNEMIQILNTEHTSHWRGRERVRCCKGNRRSEGNGVGGEGGGGEERE